MSFVFIYTLHKISPIYLQTKLLVRDGVEMGILNLQIPYIQIVPTRISFNGVEKSCRMSIQIC